MSQVERSPLLRFRVRSGFCGTLVLDRCVFDRKFLPAGAAELSDGGQRLAADLQILTVLQQVVQQQQQQQPFQQAFQQHVPSSQQADDHTLQERVLAQNRGREPRVQPLEMFSRLGNFVGR